MNQSVVILGLFGAGNFFFFYCAGLCNVQHERVVLNPRKLMLVMSHYISNFNLASQQDAEEVFFHILSSLREEFSSCYAPVHISLADVIACPNCRILSPNRRLEESEQQKWLRSFLGPFDGILGSNITCESCSFQISLDFQFFHSLHLLPLLDTGADIIPGCSLEDCLRQFFTAERLENYYCSHCWHAAAIKYLSLKDENEIYIAKLRQCSEQALPWSNSFSHTFKQLSIARSPKILCIHVQRASMNKFGELIKLEGHISFPLILNLNPFMKTGMRTKDWEENLQALQGEQQYQSQYPSNFYLQVDTTLNGIYERMGKGFPLKAANTAELAGMSSKMSGNNHGEAFEGEEQSVPQIGDFSDILSGDTLVQFDNKVGCLLACMKFQGKGELHTYCLVSVVQHFGRASSGHYTVYRSVRTKNDGDPVGPSEHSLVHWFCISDAEVYSVSEEDVLAAEASVLFYEKIS
ncbi:Ubiquitinyl hydrolase 1 [Bertholletia excelsa]